MHRDLMAGDAEVGSADLIEFDSARVHGHAGGLVVFVRLELVVGVGDGLLKSGAVVAAEDGLVDVAGFDAAFAVSLVVFFLDAMAGDAGDTLARNQRALPEGLFTRLADGRADSSVAAHAE